MSAYQLLIMTEQQLPERQFGLDRLPIDDIVTLQVFIEEHVDADAHTAFLNELRHLPDVDVDRARETFRALATSLDERKRQLACEAVAYLAAKDPESGFQIWHDLAADEEPDVREAAERAVANTLGRLSLDPLRVMGIIKTIDPS